MVILTDVARHQLFPLDFNGVLDPCHDLNSIICRSRYDGGLVHLEICKITFFS